MPIIAAPPNTRLMPTMTPIAQADVAGSPIRMTEARVRSTIPLASINPTVLTTRANDPTQTYCHDAFQDKEGNEHKKQRDYFELGLCEQKSADPHGENGG